MKSLTHVGAFGAIGALLMGCGGNPELLPRAPSKAVDHQAAEKRPRSAVVPDSRLLAGSGWTIAVPSGWTEEATEPPFEAQLVSPRPGEGRFTVHTVSLESGAGSFVQESVKGALSSGARELARRSLEIDSVQGMVVEFVTNRRESTLLGIGRVLAVPGQALAIVCSSTSKRFVTAKDTCEEVLASIRLGGEPSLAGSKPGTRVISDPGRNWSIDVPADWRELEYEPPMVALAVSADAPSDSISLSVLAAPVECAPGEGVEMAHAYLSDEVSQGSFRLLDRRNVSIAGRDGVEFDFFKERSTPAIRVAQVYLTKGDMGLVLSCGTAEDAAESVRDDCNSMFGSLRFDGSGESSERVSVSRGH